MECVLGEGGGPEERPTSLRAISVSPAVVCQSPQSAGSHTSKLARAAPLYLAATTPCGKGPRRMAVFGGNGTFEI